MSFLTFTYEVEGRNQELFIKKLVAKGVRVKKLQILNKKMLKITIDSKDRLKFFAICKNSWYNRLVKSGGVASPIYELTQNLPLLIAIILFFLVAFCFNNIYFETKFQGESQNYFSAVEKTLEQCGVKKWRFFSQKQLDNAQKLLLNEENISFVSITKSGNQAVVFIKEEVKQPTPYRLLNSDLIAQEDMLILKISVYSGRAIAQENCEVKKGDIIAKASYLIGEEEVFCPLSLALTCECTFAYFYNAKYGIDDGVKSNALALAKVALGDYFVRSYEIIQTGNNQLKVILKYEKTLFGG